MSDVDDLEFQAHLRAMEENDPGAREALAEFLNARAAESAEQELAYLAAGGPQEQPPGTEVVWPFTLDELDADERDQRVKSAPLSMTVNVGRSLIISHHEAFSDEEISAMETRHREASRPR